MEKNRSRKESKFLRELDDYYEARKRHNSSFSGTACPQNFIPGTTKAKIPNVKLVRTMSRKVSSVCYQGVLVRMKENLSVVEKGLVPAALLGLGVPTPSQHTSCLEHEIERISKRHYRKTIQSLGDVTEVTELHDNEADTNLNPDSLEFTSLRRRCFSLPTTLRDLRTMPLEYDANVGNDLTRDRKLRRSSFPLTTEEHAECGHSAVDIEDYFEIDSVMRLNELCRKAAHNHGTDHAQLNKGNDVRVNVGAHFTTSLNFMVSPDRRLANKCSKQAQSILVMPKIKWQREAVDSLERMQSLQDGGRYENAGKECDADDMESHFADGGNGTVSSNVKSEQKEIAKQEKPQQRSFIDRITSKKQKKNKSINRSLSANDQLPEEQKHTFSQIQNVLRSKLPKTLQTTVNMGLSFDPMTVKERNTKARDCNNLTAMLQGRARSGSLPGNPDHVPKSVRSKTLGNIFMTPSLFVSPPEKDEVLDRQGIIGSFLRLGRRRSTNSTGRLIVGSPASMRKDLLKVPNASPDHQLDSDELMDVDLHPMHVRKLGNVLGPEFCKMYSDSVKQRSNSLPLIRRAKILSNKMELKGSKSISGLNGKNTKRIDFRKLWSDRDTSESDLSYTPSNYDSQTDVELSDYEVEDVNQSEVQVTANSGSSAQEDSYTSEALVYLANKRAFDECNEDSLKVADSEDSENTKDNANSVIAMSIKKPLMSVDVHKNPKQKSEKTVHVPLKAEVSQRVSKEIRVDGTSLRIEKPNEPPPTKNERVKDNLREINLGLNGTERTPSLDIERMNKANKHSPQIVTKFVSLKKFKTLKSTDELIAESKINREAHTATLKKENRIDTDNQNLEVTNEALAELDALLLELQAYE